MPQPHNFQFGGESRILLSNFFQPAHPSGRFAFGQSTTAQSVFNPDSNQGNALASLLVGFGQGGDLSIHPSVAEKSRETSFFFQDDWKFSSKLTLNLGLR
jgi:outer membrane receptor protein involved in Fe transport